MLFLSKSKYCMAVQCPKMLWLKKNKPECFDDSVMNQSVLEAGNEVGDLAMGLFGPFVEVPFGDLSKMIAETKVLIDADTPIIAEASFSYGYYENAFLEKVQSKCSQNRILRRLPPHISLHIQI